MLRPFINGCDEVTQIDYNTLRLFPGLPYNIINGHYYVKDHHELVAETLFSAIRDAQRESKTRYWRYLNHARAAPASWWHALDPCREHIFMLQRLDWGRCLVDWLETRLVEE